MNLRKDPCYFSKRNFIGGSLMVWGGFSPKGTLELAFPSCRMNSVEYVDLLKMNLLPFLSPNQEINYIFQQDNAPFLSTKETKGWIRLENVEVLEWPACSPDMNPIGNVWGILVSKLYSNNRKHNSVAELKSAV